MSTSVYPLPRLPDDLELVRRIKGRRGCSCGMKCFPDEHPQTEASGFHMEHCQRYIVLYAHHDGKCPCCARPLHSAAQLFCGGCGVDLRDPWYRPRGPYYRPDDRKVS